jgi:hypothetical protein
VDATVPWTLIAVVPAGSVSPRRRSKPTVAIWNGARSPTSTWMPGPAPSAPRLVVSEPGTSEAIDGTGTLTATPPTATEPTDETTSS